MINASLLVLVAPIEEQLLPAVDNALRQIKNGIIGLRNEENRRKIQALSIDQPGLPALIFARDFGFCAQLLLKPGIKQPVRTPSRFMPFASEVAAGWAELAPGSIKLLYPKEPLASEGVVSEMLPLLNEANIREAFKEGMTVIADNAVWEGLLALARDSSRPEPFEAVSAETAWNRIQSGEIQAASAVEEVLHSGRGGKRWIYQDEELRGLVAKCLALPETGREEESYLRFVAGLQAFHQLQVDNAVQLISEAYRSRFSCSWINEALARVLFVGEGARAFKGKQESVYDVYTGILRAARSDRPVLIVGDRGTGKELVAREIHRFSRPGHPLVAINIGALTGDIVHSELFGHEKGVLAGAERANIGAFGRAAEGTLFIDEIGNADLKVQKKLLRVIEYGRYYQVGGETELDCKARILCATNRDLSQLVKQNGFMEDLLHRISVFQIQLKPLREMGSDVVRLLEAELPGVAFGEDARELLGAYDWPGNFRELKAVAERIRATERKYIFREDLGSILKVHVIPSVPAGPPSIDYDVPTIQEFRKILKQLNDQEIRKYVCNQYVKQKRDWKRMLEAISSRREHRHNTKECLKRCGLTERSVAQSCAASREN
jgi:DNA-binding NtrC family response regulator